MGGPILPEERCRTDRALMGARVDYLVATEKETELEALLAAPSDVFDDALRAASRGAMQGKLGRRAAAERAFVDAIETGGRMDLAMPFVAREAERIGATDVAVRALRRWMEVPGSALPAGRRLTELLETLLDVREKAAGAIVLGANGRREAARQMIRSIPKAQLKLQMEQLLRPFL